MYNRSTTEVQVPRVRGASVPRQPAAWNKLAGQAQQLLFERTSIFARIDSKVEDPQLICCILSSLGQNSLCMYMIAVLCGGSNGAGLFIRWSALSNLSIRQHRAADEGRLPRAGECECAFAGRHPPASVHPIGANSHDFTFIAPSSLPQPLSQFSHEIDARGAEMGQSRSLLTIIHFRVTPSDRVVTI